jgi:hypothetical protein
MNYYEKYGKITLSKGTILYHWSNETITNLTDNLFLCLDNSLWSDKNKVMHKYKLIKDINLILTIQNDNIINKKLYSSNKNKKQDYELLTNIYNDILTPNSYSRGGDVSLKTNKTKFLNFCDKLTINGYEGLFNYIDGDEGQFEIVIFEPNKYLRLIENKNYENVKLHKLNDCKRIMLSRKINYIYPYDYDYEDINKREHHHYPSIFYYIYKKTK